MTKSLVDKLIKISLPLFIEAWKLRALKHSDRSDDVRKIYREGYWDGVIDTLQIGLKEKGPPKDTMLH